MAFQKYQQKYHLVREANAFSVTTFYGSPRQRASALLALEPQLGAISPCLRLHITRG
jgi:hypothetical protein